MPSLPPQTSPLTQPKLLIGEGQDEVYFFDAFIQYLGLTGIQTEHYGGKNNLGKYLKEFRLRPGNHAVVSLGITRDADTDVDSALQSISGALTAIGLAVPSRAGQFVRGSPRVSVYIMPDNQRSGMLEDLCLDAVQNDVATPCVDEFFKCVAQKSNRQPNPLAKARVHAWLASQFEPDLRLGEAARKNIWPWDNPAFTQLQQFLRSL